jgi:hypothetical protein
MAVVANRAIKSSIFYLIKPRLGGNKPLFLAPTAYLRNKGLKARNQNPVKYLYAAQFSVCANAFSDTFKQ